MIFLLDTTALGVFGNSHGRQSHFSAPLKYVHLSSNSETFDRLGENESPLENR